MEGTAFSIEEASFDASLLPEGSRTPGSEAFHRAVTDYFQRSYAGMGGQLSVVFAAGRIEVAWEPAAPEAPAMATIGPLLQQRRFDEARPLLETLLQLQPEHPEALYNLGVLASEEGQLEEARHLLRLQLIQLWLSRARSTSPPLRLEMLAIKPKKAQKNRPSRWFGRILPRASALSKHAVMHPAD